MSKKPRHTTTNMNPFSIPIQDELTRWFYNCLIRQGTLSKENWSPFENYYEFGVGCSSTMTIYLRALNRYCIEYGKDQPFWVYFNRGSLYYRSNDLKKAYEDLKKAYEDLKKAYELDSQNEVIKIVWDLIDKNLNETTEKLG